MHILKNIIVSGHGFEHVSYVTRYVFGEVTEEENKRNGGVGDRFSSHLFYCDTAKRGKCNFGKLGIENNRILEDLREILIFYFLSLQRLKIKKIP